MTLESLRRSHRLRTLVLDNDKLHLLMQSIPKGSFDKEPTRTDKLQTSGFMTLQ